MALHIFYRNNKRIKLLWKNCYANVLAVERLAECNPNTSLALIEDYNLPNLKWCHKQPGSILSTRNAKMHVIEAAPILSDRCSSIGLRQLHPTYKDKGYRRLCGRRTYLGAKTKNDAQWSIFEKNWPKFKNSFDYNKSTYRWVGARTSYLRSARKNVLSQLGV